MMHTINSITSINLDALNSVDSIDSINSIFSINSVKEAKRINSRRGIAYGRSCRGDLAIELSCGAFLFLVFSMLSFDLGLLVFCADFNDRACRDAARAAAQGSDLASATKLAQVALKAHSPAIAFMSPPTIQGVINYVDFGGHPPNSYTSPFVQVTTFTNSKIPTGPVEFLGAKFLPGGQVTFVQTYTFPIIRTK